MFYWESFSSEVQITWQNVRLHHLQKIPLWNRKLLYAKYVFYPGIRNLVYVKFSPIAIEQLLAHDFWKEKKTFMEHRNRKNVILA